MDGGNNAPAQSVSTSSAESPKLQYYRRPLPLTCISFCSVEGKAIFREALLAGHMETYFALASQFRTQEEPAFCGLSTLVMVLNALEVDPKKIWKGPWRWYHENMLDCCVPMEVIEKRGVTFDQFTCLAICNTLDVTKFRADGTTSEDMFRQLVIEKTRCSNDVVVVSYSRKVLEQTGDGHYSPIGGYNPDRDLVLILDVARFKYPPHWVSLSLLFKSMTELDEETNMPRGYLLLTKSVASLPTVLFRFSSEISVTRYVEGSESSTPASEMACVQKWQQFLAESCSEQMTNVEVMETVAQQFVNHLDAHGYSAILLTSQIELDEQISCEHQQAVADILQAVESVTLFTAVSQFTGHSVNTIRTDVEADGDPVVQSCLACRRLARPHFITMLLLLWPYTELNNGSWGSRMRSVVDVLLHSCDTKASGLLTNELQQLRRQLQSILGLVNVFSHCRCPKKQSQVSLPSL